MTFKWLPNALTIARCVFALFCLGGIVMAHGGHVVISPEATQDIPADEVSRRAAIQQLWYQFALFAFLAGALTDFLDGWLARRLNAQSRFGVWLDPIADKLLVGLTLLGLCIVLRSPLVYLPAAAIIARDIFMTWLRTTPRGRSVVDPSSLAKWKTAFEMVAIIGLLLPFAVVPQDAVSQTNAGSSPVVLGVFLLVGLLWVAAALSLWTGWRYMLAAVRRTRR